MIQFDENYSFQNLRGCQLNNKKEISVLEYGMDFREMQYRREVFLRFYEFHTKVKGHAGGVYYILEHLAKELNLDQNGKLWLAYINGCTQHPITTYLIIRRFPSLENIDIHELKSWFDANYKKLGWDTDRRYFKAKFIQCVLDYKQHMNGGSQADFFNNICNTLDPKENFRKLWDKVLNEFKYMGRLSTFSYIEYLRILGLNVECDQLFLGDMKGSKSHRNGLCIVLGRDDLYDRKDNKVTYSPECIEWLAGEAEQLLKEAKERFGGKHVNYFTLETTLCCYKGWHKVNRRYPNVYNDMFFDRVRKSEEIWGNQFKIFWDSREFLGDYLRLERNKTDIGFCKEKQNHYRLTGEVIMMDNDYPAFKNNLRTKECKN